MQSHFAKRKSSGCSKFPSLSSMGFAAENESVRQQVKRKNDFVSDRPAEVFLLQLTIVLEVRDNKVAGVWFENPESCPSQSRTNSIFPFLEQDREFRPE